VAVADENINIVSKNGDILLVTENHCNPIQGTMYLFGILGIAKSITEGPEIPSKAVRKMLSGNAL